MRRLVSLVVIAALAGCGPRYADLSLTPSQLIAQSEDALRRGEYATAAAGFNEYLASGQQTFRARAFYQLAQAQYGQENYEAALGTIADLESEYPSEHWPQAPTLRGDVYYALGKRVDAITAWEAAWAEGSEGDRVFLRSRIEEASTELTPGERDALGDDLTNVDVRDIPGLGAPHEFGGAPAALPPIAAGALPPADEGTAPAAAEDAAPAGAEGTAPAVGAQPLADSEAREAALAADTIPPDDLAAGDALAERLQLPTVLLAPDAALTGPYVVRADARSAPQDFAARFRGEHGRDPGTIEADAYAAGTIVREAIAAGARSRGAILEALRKDTRTAGS